MNGKNSNEQILSDTKKMIHVSLIVLSLNYYEIL